MSTARRRNTLARTPGARVSAADGRSGRPEASSRPARPCRTRMESCPCASPAPCAQRQNPRSPTRSIRGPDANTRQRAASCRRTRRSSAGPIPPTARWPYPPAPRPGGSWRSASRADSSPARRRVQSTRLGGGRIAPPFLAGRRKSARAGRRSPVTYSSGPLPC